MSAAGAKPPTQRPELPDFWDQRFAEGVTPWNAGGVPAELSGFAAACAAGGAPAPRVLIPGCGHAWEAGYLAARGWQVDALDFSAVAIAAARAQLGDWPGRLLHADFFAFDAPAPYDLVYERAFLCALPRRLWPDYAPRVARLLRPGGLLAGYFLLGDEPKGPPFAIQPEALDALLGADFERVDDRPATGSIPVFAGRERWQVWRRR